jgi:L-fuconolactonase
MTAQVLDTHVHLLDPAHLTYPWLHAGDPLTRPWPAALYADDAPAVTAAIIVEAGVAPGQTAREVSWVRAQAAAHPWIRGIVAHAPVDQSAALKAALAACRHDALVVGVRRNLQDQPPGFLRNPALHDGIRHLGQAGLPFDACVRSWQLAELGELAAACPDTVIVLDHLGKPRCDEPGKLNGEIHRFSRLRLWICGEQRGDRLIKRHCARRVLSNWPGVATRRELCGSHRILRLRRRPNRRPANRC